MIKVSSIKEFIDCISNLNSDVSDLFDNVVTITIYDAQGARFNKNELEFKVDNKWYAFDLDLLKPVFGNYIYRDKIMIHLSFSGALNKGAK